MVTHKEPEATIEYTDTETATRARLQTFRRSLN